MSDTEANLTDEVGPFRFYLGTHEPSWLAKLDVPLMVSRNRLDRLSKLPTSRVDWVLDSGGFTELQKYGRWRTDAREHAATVERYAAIGRLIWASPQDWMCEPAVIHGGTFKGVTFAGTGLSVAEHQARTVGNYLELKALGAPVIPVLQGYTLAEYERCVELYAAAGVDLAAEPTVGLGSVCRRENTDEIGSVVWAMTLHGLRLHGFGCKEGAITRVGSLLASADSMAWSKGGKERGTCTHLKSRCANHAHWALDWRRKLLAATPGGTAQTAMALA
jgi:hypothetical protein